MITAKIVVSLTESPGYGKTRYQTARMSFGFMNPEHSSAEIKIFR
jgi:hypothetical protein